MGLLRSARNFTGRALARVGSRLPGRPDTRPPQKLQYLGTVQKRASRVGRLVWMLTGGSIEQRPTVHYEVNAREGYESNPVVYRCIRMVAEALKSMPLLVYEGEDEVENHPLRTLFEAPNPRQTLGELIDEIVGHMYLAGETFVEGVVPDLGTMRGQIAELYALRPDRVSPVPGEDGEVASYTYEAASGRRSYPVPMRGYSPILHMRQWNPRNHWRGLPIVAPASAPADEYAESVAQNRALVRNGVQPSGALIYAPKEGSDSLADEQFERITSQLDENHTGPENAGRPMVLDGGLTWMQMGQSQRDAQVIEARAGAARDIALALGVPPMVLGLPGDNTYANYEEANAAFWRQTVWPLARFIAEKFTVWVRPLHPGVRLTFDQEASPMAEAERSLRWERSEKATDLTIDERRELKGYDKLDGGKGEHVLVASSLSILDDVILGEPDPEEAALDAYGAGGKPNDAEDDDAQD